MRGRRCASRIGEHAAPGPGEARRPCPLPAPSRRPSSPAEFDNRDHQPLLADDAPGRQVRSTERPTAEGALKRVVVTVTDRTKQIANGVEARRDPRRRQRGRRAGRDHRRLVRRRTPRANVWYLGEDTAEYKDGKVVTARAGSFDGGRVDERAARRDHAGRPEAWGRSTGRSTTRATPRTSRRSWPWARRSREPFETLHRHGEDRGHKPP